MSYSSEVLADSPLLYWRMGDTSGTLATDSSGNGRNGTINNASSLTAASLLTSDADPSFDFDGANDFLSLTYGAWADVTSFSVEAWVNLDVVGTKERVVFIRFAPGGNEYIRVSVLATGAVRVGIRVGGTYSTYTTTTLLTAGTTYHLVATYDQANVKVFINNVQALSTAKTGALNSGGSPVIRVGAYDATNFQLDGRIDELAFYGAALSSTRVGAHYAAATAVAGVSGSLAVSLPAVTSAAVGSYVTPPVPGSLAVELPAVVAGFSGTAPTGAVSGSLDVVLPALSALFESVASTGTRADITSARHRSGIGFASWTPNVAPLPVGYAAGTAVDKALAFGPVSIVGTQPTFDVTEAAQPRHRDRIIIGGRDVTFFRGAEVRVSQFQLMEPFGYGTATIEFPQVYPDYETIGEGDLDWLAPEKRVIIQRVDAAGNVVATDYKGRLIAPNASTGTFSYEVGGEVTGPASLRFRPMPLFRSTQDVGRQLWRALWQLDIRVTPRLGVDTGIELGRVGGMPFLDHLQQLVGRAWTRNGNQWTVMPNADGAYEIRRKDRTTIHGTCYLSASSVEADLRRDISEEPNRVFATGVTPSGKRVRFGVYPGLEQGPVPAFPGNLSEGDSGEDVLTLIHRLRVHGHLDAEDTPAGVYDSSVTEAVRAAQEDANLPITGITNAATWDAVFDVPARGLTTKLSRIEPAAQRSYTRRFRTSPSGAVLGRNPNYDPTRLRIDREVDFGSGFKRSQMREWSKAEIVDGSAPNWVGSLTIHSGAVVAGEHTPGDPITDILPARDIRPGMNLWLPQFDGGTLVHVTAATVAGAVVTLQVDTRARDAWNVAQVIERDRESRKDPARAFFRRLAQSNVSSDAVMEWSEVGGLISEQDLTAGWNVVEVVGGDSGIIQKIRLDTNPNAESAVAVFGKRVWPNVLQREIGDPLTETGTARWSNENVLDRLRRDHGLLYSAGSNLEPGGYSPGGYGTDGTGTFTGRFEDEAGIQYYTDTRPILYVAIWVDRDTTIPAGRIMWPNLEPGI